MTKPNMDTFCVVPFTMLYSLNNGDYRACCHSEPGFPSDLDKTKPANYFVEPVEDVWNNEYYRTLRKDLVNGVENKTCATCWKMQANNEYSFRQKYNLNKPNPNDVIAMATEAIENDGRISKMPESIQIKQGNMCNLKCIMCNQASSNLIQDEIDIWKQRGEKIPDWLDWVDGHEIDWTGIDENTNFDDLWTNLKHGLRNVDQLQLVGGEPLVNPSTPLILERLVAEGYAHDIRVYFISNLIILTDKLIDTLSNFKEVVISVSWDHVDPDKFYFIRFPGKYSKFRKNIDKLLASNIEPKVSVTVDIFNIYDIAEIFAEFETVSQTRDSEYTINLQYVEKPEYFSLRYLEPEQKQDLIAMSKKFLEDTKDYKLWKDNTHAYQQIVSLEQILSDTPNDFDRVVKERTRVLRMYDLMRKTDYKSLFPYIKDYV